MAPGAMGGVFRAPDGDSDDALAARIGEWLCEQDEVELVIVVAHRVVRGLYAKLPREIPLTLPAPRDRIFRLSGGLIEVISV